MLESVEKDEASSKDSADDHWQDYFTPSVANPEHATYQTVLDGLSLLSERHNGIQSSIATLEEDCAALKIGGEQLGVRFKSLVSQMAQYLELVCFAFLTFRRNKKHLPLLRRLNA
jgi:hypothetical protein